MVTILGDLYPHTEFHRRTLNTLLLCFLFRQAFCNPDLDDRLPRNSKSLRFFVERLDHPDRKIDIDPSLLLCGTVRLRNFEVLRNVFTTVEFIFELFSFDRFRPPLFSIDV